MEIFTQPSEIINQLDIVSGMKVADLGVGSGHYTKALSEIVGEDGVVFAVEVQQEVLTRLRTDMEQEGGFPNVKYLWGDLEHPRGTKIADDTVDVVVLSNTLFQIEDKESCLAEVRRISKPHAEILFVDWSDSHDGLGPIPDHVISPEDAQKYFSDAGFVFFKKIETGLHHYAQVYKLTSK
jgi:ubiquinone/menaquinone biosynthesis C-methylase UbiE